MSTEQICGFCGNKTTVNWVHGHGECSICHSNIDECCSGECVVLPQPLLDPLSINASGEGMGHSRRKHLNKEKPPAEVEVVDKVGEVEEEPDDKNQKMPYLRENKPNRPNTDF